MLDIDKAHVLAVGNDYNDLDLLEWAGTAFLVDNAPDMLKNRCVSVASNDQGGVSEAIHLWQSDFTRLGIENLDGKGFTSVNIVSRKWK